MEDDISLSLTDYDGSINMDAVKLDDMEERAGEQQGRTQQQQEGRVKVPRRIIHFVSGETMEEYSTDEEEEDLPEIKPPPPKNVGPYVWFHLSKATLSVCDYMGEKFADLLGLSSAKYQYAIDQHDRQKKKKEEEEERKRKEDQLPEESERYVIDQLRSEEYWDERITIPDVSDAPPPYTDLTHEMANL